MFDLAELCELAAESVIEGQRRGTLVLDIRQSAVACPDLDCLSASLNLPRHGGAAFEATSDGFSITMGQDAEWSCRNSR